MPVVILAPRNGLLLSEATLKAGKIRSRTGLGTGRSGPYILHRPGNCVTQLARRAQRPVGVAQHLTGKQHKVRLAVTNNLVCLDRRGDETDGPGRYPGLAPDSLREGRLVTGAKRDLGLRDVPAG